MIGRLTGRVAAQEPDGAVVLDVGGVGYELAAPLGTLGRAHVDDTGRVTLWVHTHVREDALALFGFADEAERAAFRALLGVSNVGPKIAVAVLGALPAAELARAVARRDLGALTAVSGIGRKIAERLLLELRDKLPALPAPSARAAAGAAGGPAHGPATVAERLRAALTGMGFRPAEADRAVSSLGERAADAPFEELLREALALLAK
jgi:Holliday junction DNA helicase RuvA